MMEDLFIKKLPEKIWHISKFKRDKISGLLHLLYKCNSVSGILLGGSTSYKDDLEKSDIDLFCLVNHVHVFEKNLKQTLYTLKDIDTIVFQGAFPWTQNLHTIYFKDDIDFSIDLCLINSLNADSFFWEPDGYIIFDKEETINNCRRAQMNSNSFTRQPFLKPNPFTLSIIALKKIDKNLSREHLWNALEQLSILRRYIMQIIRINVIKDNFFLGRVDRDIEDVLPSDLNLKLSQTIAIYNSKDIAQKTIIIVEILLNLTIYLKETNELIYLDWIIKQLEHERDKMKNYLINA